MNDYASSIKVNLGTHLEAHNGEKSNKCTQCDFAFSEAGDLRRHLETQSREKSFFIILLEGHQTYSVYLATI